MHILKSNNIFVVELNCILAKLLGRKSLRKHQTLEPIVVLINIKK